MSRAKEKLLCFTFVKNVLYEEVKKKRKLSIKRRKVNALFSDIHISWLL
jgi:hypothetical protein